MTRIEDVGNPWLDAGIVPFSTMNFNERYSTDKLNWADWYPVDLVTECFPGQFRNWFYSLLSLSTMMRFDLCRRTHGRGKTTVPHAAGTSPCAERAG